MGETRNLIGIYGAIDLAVMDEPGRRAPVSRLLPLYREAPVDWYRDFTAWTNEKREDTSIAAFPELEEALGGLADTEPSGRMRARRLFAIAVAAQAFPRILEEPGTEAATSARRALRVPGLADDDEEAGRLLALLGDEGLLGDIEDEAGALDVWWRRVLAEASAAGLIDDPEGMGPRPCTGKLVMVDLPGGRFPAATLTTEWETDRIDFERAISFLEPVNWPHCCSFWCDMTKLGPDVGGVHQYHEEVSTDCFNKPAAWTLEAYLDFIFDKSDDLATTEYRLSKGRPQPDVLVDEGSLVVQRIGPAAAHSLKITTTKRIRFARSFSGEALAMIMCALGYASVVEDLVFDCAALPEGEPGTEFPARSPAAAEHPGGEAMNSFADQAATAVKECIDDCAEAAEVSRKAMVEGRYTADALVRDVTGIWARLLRDGATAVDIGVRSARTAARTRDRTRARKRPPS